MIETITIDTDTHVVVPVELLKKARLCIEDYIEGAPSDGTDEKCMDDISSILATKQPEQAQQSKSVGFRFRLKGADKWDFNFHRAPDSFELRECEIEPLYT